MGRPPHQDVSYEESWQARWRHAGLFRAVRRHDRPKWFIVELPPFANGRLHLGHVRNYVIGDVVARFRRAAGFDVLYTTGFDSFGLPNEIAAREEGISPAALVERNCPIMAEQLRRLGLSHDPTRVLSDHEPGYYRWVQWVFLRLYEAGYAFRRRETVNWCGACGTTLADSLVESGNCWRCRGAVTRIDKEQWFVRETGLAEPLLTQELPGWPETIRSIHRDWIGRRQGVEAAFRVEGTDTILPVFAEGPADLAASGFVAIAPTSLEAVRLGIADLPLAGGLRDTGLAAIEPVSGRRLPLILCDAPRRGEDGPRLGRPQADEEDRRIVERLALDRCEPTVAAPPDPGAVRPVIRTRLRDWDIARSRYWGTPVPIVHCRACGEVAVPDADLPVLLPEEVDLGPEGNPLDRLASFTEAACPSCGGCARRETDTLEAYSSPWWYYLICAEPGDACPFRSEGARRWMPVDLMIGGADQARTCFFHLRTMAEALVRLGITDEPRPVRGLLPIGMVKADGRKMSKSAGNSVDPADLVERYGADAVRWAVIAAAAPDQDFNWADDRVVRAARFLSGIRRFFARHAFAFDDAAAALQPCDPRRRRLVAWVAAAERKVTGSLERNALHVAAQQVAFLAEQVLKLDRDLEQGRGSPDEEAFAFAGRALLHLLAPFTPHLAEELWSRAGGRGFLAEAAWPLPIDGAGAGRAAADRSLPKLPATA